MDLFNVTSHLAPLFKLLCSLKDSSYASSRRTYVICKNPMLQREAASKGHGVQSSESPHHLSAIREIIMNDGSSNR
jgi:hypothetical protein